MLFAILLLISSGGFSAQAHTFLVNSNPGANQILENLPETISLTFNEEIKAKKEAINLRDSQGKVVDFKFELKGDTVHVYPESNNSATGTYLITYNVVSGDGHLVSGAIPFSIKIASETTSIGLGSFKSKIVKTGEVMLWFIIILLGLLRYKMIKNVLSKVLPPLGLSILLFNFYYLYSKLGLNLWENNPGRYLLVLAVGFLLANFAKYKFVYLINSGVFASLALYSSHTLDLPGLMVLFKFGVALHLVAIYFWLGALVALSLNKSSTQLQSTRKISTWSIGFTILGGGASLIAILVNSNITWSSAWIKFLILKLVIFIILALLGAYHHLKSNNDKQVDSGLIKKSLTIEIAFFMAVLIASGGLTSNGAPLKAREVVTSSTYTGEVTFDNKVSGSINISGAGSEKMVMLTFKQALPNSVEKLEIYASNEKLNIKDIPGKLSGTGGHFMGNLVLPYKGEWNLLVEYYEDEFTIVQSRVKIKV